MYNISGVFRLKMRVNRKNFTYSHKNFKKVINILGLSNAVNYKGYTCELLGDVCYEEFG